MEIKETTKPIERTFEIRLTYAELSKIKHSLIHERENYKTNSITYCEYQKLLLTIEDSDFYQK